MWFICLLFFFFKQKTAYEMRISDWSSDVCSSDLRGGGVRRQVRSAAFPPFRRGRRRDTFRAAVGKRVAHLRDDDGDGGRESESQPTGRAGFAGDRRTDRKSVV